MVATPGAQSAISGFTSIDDGMTVDDNSANEFRMNLDDSDGSDESNYSKMTGM